MPTLPSLLWWSGSLVIWQMEGAQLLPGISCCSVALKLLPALEEDLETDYKCTILGQMFAEEHPQAPVQAGADQLESSSAERDWECWGVTG